MVQIADVNYHKFWFLFFFLCVVFFLYYHNNIFLVSWTINPNKVSPHFAFTAAVIYYNFFSIAVINFCLRCSSSFSVHLFSIILMNVPFSLFFVSVFHSPFVCSMIILKAIGTWAHLHKYWQLNTFYRRLNRNEQWQRSHSDRHASPSKTENKYRKMNWRTIKFTKIDVNWERQKENENRKLKSKWNFLR